MGEFVGLPGLGEGLPGVPPVPGIGAAQPPVPAPVKAVHDAVRLGSVGTVASAVQAEAELRQALRVAAAALNAAGVESPRADAELLAGHLLGVDRGRVAVMALMGEPVPEGYGELIARRAARIPLQHLTGTAPFRALNLAVGPGVFVPRPETELVAGAAIEAARTMIAEGHVEPLVVDLCTGSGAIAASVATEVPACRVIAVELSAPALAYARRNLADAAPARGRAVELVHGDALTALDHLLGTVDIVVSNPPYIPDTRVHAAPEVADHDPVPALYGGGADGMEFPSRLVRRAARLLRAGGALVMEHDETQEDAMRALLGASPAWDDVEIHRDLTGRVRYTSARRTEAAPDPDPHTSVGE